MAPVLLQDSIDPSRPRLNPGENRKLSSRSAIGISSLSCVKPSNYHISRPRYCNEPGY